MLRKVLAAAAVAVVTISAERPAHAIFYWTPWVSEENGGPWAYCTSWDEAAVGFGCQGDYCDDVRLMCETFPNGMRLDPSTQWIVRWFSEEGALPPGVGTTGMAPNQAQCRMHIPGTIDAWRRGVVSAVHCRGDYCDDLQVECEDVVKYQGSTPVAANVSSCKTLGPYSEENGSVDFGANWYIFGITCTGDYCDNKKFEVCRFTAPF